MFMSDENKKIKRQQEKKHVFCVKLAESALWHILRPADVTIVLAVLPPAPDQLQVVAMPLDGWYLCVHVVLCVCLKKK